MPVRSARLHQQIPSELPVPYASVVELFDDRTRTAPDRIFIIAPGSVQHTYTFSQFSDLSRKACDFLVSRGFSAGDAISILIPNSIEFLVAYFGALRTGLVVVPVNQDLAPEEIKFIIRNSNSKGLIIDNTYDFKIENLELPFAADRVFRVGAMPDFEMVMNRPVPETVPTVPGDVTRDTLIIYTSGTTGHPKGVVLSHMNLLADAKAIADWFGFDPSTRTLCILPLFHNNGQVVTFFAPLYAGGSTVIVKGKSSLMAFWGLIREYGITWTSVMPSILSILLSIKVIRTDETLRGIICGGQVLKPAVQEAFEATFGVPVFEGFGLTETTSFSCFNRYPAHLRRKGTVGPALPVNEMKIVDADDREVPPMTEGEICIRGYNVASEYLGLPDRNMISFRNGWFHSGDYGYMDEEGWLYFKERKDNLIIKGGENIYPAELENVLYQHPDVLECAVIGIPDKLLGEDLCAFVRLSEQSTHNEQTIKQFCTSRIASFKLPKKIVVINALQDLDGIPKGPTQKILYNKLKEYYLTTFIPK